LRSILDTVRSFVVVVDPRGIVREASRAVEAATGLSAGELARPVWELAEHPAEREMLEEALGPARRQPLPAVVRFHLSHGTSASRLVAWDVRSLSDGQGGAVVVLTGDVVEHRPDAPESTRLEAELVNARLLLLVTASKQLSQTTSPAETLETLVRLVTPGLADWSYVIHRGSNGRPRLAASAHRDPNKAQLLTLLAGALTDPNAGEGTSRAFGTGQSQVYADITSEDLAPGGRGTAIVGVSDPRGTEVLSQLGMRALMCVPIAGRVGVDAVLTLVSASDPHRYGPDEVVVAEDLTSRAAVTLESGRLLVEALEALHGRDEFLAVAAHEMRTPLTALMLQIHSVDRMLARECPGASVVARGVGGIETQATRLSKLVNGLLDVVQLGTNRMPLRFEELDLRQLVEGVLATMGGDFERAGCQVITTLPKAVEVRWDRLRIEQVLTNLLTNAVKFAGGRPIEVRVTASPTSVRIAVRDHGPGIAKEDQGRIFARFERAVSTRNFGGLGLGLYISAQLLRMHQGSLRVESEPGQGACFIVDLPRGLRSRAAVSDLATGSYA